MSTARDSRKRELPHPRRPPRPLFTTVKQVTTADEKRGNDATALYDATPTLRASRSGLRTLMAQLPPASVLAFSHHDLHDDDEFVKAAVEQDGLAIRFATDRLRNEREIILAAVASNGLALWYATEILRRDFEVVYAAVQQNAHALNYAAGDVQEDPRLIEAAKEQRRRSGSGLSAAEWRQELEARTKAEKARRRSRDVPATPASTLVAGSLGGSPRSHTLATVAPEQSEQRRQERSEAGGSERPLSADASFSSYPWGVHGPAAALAAGRLGSGAGPAVRRASSMHAYALPLPRAASYDRLSRSNTAASRLKRCGSPRAKERPPGPGMWLPSVSNIRPKSPDGAWMASLIASRSLL